MTGVISDLGGPDDNCDAGSYEHGEAFGATRQGWSKGIGGGETFMKLWASSSGCATRPATGEPARAGIQPCDGARKGLGDAEVGARAGHGACGPETSHLPGGRGCCMTCRPSQPLRSVGQARPVSGGVCDPGTSAEDGPGTWKALTSPRPIPVLRRAGDPSPTHDTLGSARVVGPQAQHKRWHRGRLLARETGAVADGGRGSEGGIRAWTSGNGVPPGPGRAQAARVDVTFRRAPCPMH